MKIETKFDLNQKIYDIWGNCWEVQTIELTYNNYNELWEIYRLGNKGTDKYSCCIFPNDKDTFFTSKAEAEQKIKEIKNGLNRRM